MPPRSSSRPKVAARPAGPEAGSVTILPLDDTLGYLLRRAQLAAFQSFNQIFGPAGVTPAQYSVLLTIDRNPGLQQKQLANALGIKQANFVGLIANLEKRGLVSREQATDRRSYSLTLTRQGQKLLVALEALGRELDHRLARALSRTGITPETLARGLKAISAMAESASDEAHATEATKNGG
jgi:DNA-binding MarR family transcriptional regulator